MLELIPGTVLNFNSVAADNCYSVIAPLLTVTKGLTLAQVRELTGLEASTIQNWVKRGWVKNPEGKRYGEEQVMRIILINMMRGSMQLEQIAFLMSYINQDSFMEKHLLKSFYFMVCGLACVEISLF